MSLQMHTWDKQLFEMKMSFTVTLQEESNLKKRNTAEGAA